MALQSLPYLAGSVVADLPHLSPAKSRRVTGDLTPSAYTFQGMGRPHARTDLKALERVITARVTDSELEVLREAADARGLTISAYVRLASIGTATLPPATQDHRLVSAGGAVM